jgi:hypothetical protein
MTLTWRHSEEDANGGRGSLSNPLICPPIEWTMQGRDRGGICRPDAGAMTHCFMYSLFIRHPGTLRHFGVELSQTSAARPSILKVPSHRALAICSYDPSPLMQ